MTVDPALAVGITLGALTVFAITVIVHTEHHPHRTRDRDPLNLDHREGEE